MGRWRGDRCGDGRSEGDIGGGGGCTAGSAALVRDKGEGVMSRGRCSCCVRAASAILKRERCTSPPCSCSDETSSSVLTSVAPWAGELLSPSTLMDGPAGDAAASEPCATDPSAFPSSAGCGCCSRTRSAVYPCGRCSARVRAACRSRPDASGESSGEFVMMPYVGDFKVDGRISRSKEDGGDEIDIKIKTNDDVIKGCVNLS